MRNGFTDSGTHKTLHADAAIAHHSREISVIQRAHSNRCHPHGEIKHMLISQVREGFPKGMDTEEFIEEVANRLTAYIASADDVKRVNPNTSCRLAC